MKAYFYYCLDCKERQMSICRPLEEHKINLKLSCALWVGLIQFSSQGGTCYTFGILFFVLFVLKVVVCSISAVSFIFNMPAPETFFFIMQHKDL